MSHQSDLISTDIDAYLQQHQHKQLLRFITCGSVDDGKSTLIGRLLHDSKMIYEDQLAAIENDSKKSGTTGEKIDLALLVDGLAAEREQGITIDVAYRYFSTSRRKFIIADTPGHEQYTRNMATGASTCDLAIILIDARYGVMTQTRRHSYIAHLLGIQHVIVAVNKMDLVDFSERRFHEIRDEYLTFAESLSIPDIHFAPISALEGDNVVSASKHTPWYQGLPLMEMLETIELNENAQTVFRLPVQYVNRPNLNFRGFAGTIAGGSIKPGDRVRAIPSGFTSTVKDIVTFDGNLTEAHVGQAITLTLADEIDVSRGDMLIKADESIVTGEAFRAKLVWMTDQPLVTGRQYYFKIGTQNAIGSVTAINHTINVNTMAQDTATELALNSIADVSIRLNKVVCFDSYNENRHTGSFIVIDRLTNGTVGAGMIESKLDSTKLAVITEEDRQRRYNQKPVSIIIDSEDAAEQAVQLEQVLFNSGHVAVIVRPEDALTVCPYLEAAGLIAIVAGGRALPFGLAFTNASPQEIVAELQKEKLLG